MCVYGHMSDIMIKRAAYVVFETMIKRTPYVITPQSALLKRPYAYKVYAYVMTGAHMSVRRYICVSYVRVHMMCMP